MSPPPDESHSPDGIRTPDESAFRIPRGDLLRSRVVSDLSTPLGTALDRDLSGYATIVPQETLLLSGDVRGVITFEDGVPMVAYNSVTDNGGADALAELAVPGPYRVELYRVTADALDIAHEADDLRVAPGSVATELADDAVLAERTRSAAPDHRTRDHGTEEVDAVAAFLADDDRIDAIREQARSEARSRAEAWGFSEAIETNDSETDSGEYTAIDRPENSAGDSGVESTPTRFDSTETHDVSIARGTEGVDRPDASGPDQ